MERFYKGNRQELIINQKFAYITSIDYQEAEKFFSRTKTVNEIPVMKENGQLSGIIRKEKEEIIRIRQRKALKEARTKEALWHKGELSRFVKNVKARIYYYYVREKFCNCLRKEDIDILRIRRENTNLSEWRGLSDEEWRKFWGSAYRDGIVEQMRVESEQTGLSVINGVTSFIDMSGQCFQFKQGYRITPNVPTQMSRRIFMFGPCIVAGGYCEDGQTISAYLQDTLITNNYMSWGVINRGVCAFEACYERMFVEEISEDDIVIIWGKEEWVLDDEIRKLFVVCRDMGDIFLEIPRLVDNIERTVLHCNYRVNQKLAERMYKDIRLAGSLDISKRSAIPEKMQNFYINWRIYEYFLDYFERYNLRKYEADVLVGAIVMNCNPFTLGHRYLIEQALGQVDKLYVFVVEEDKSFFKFEDRLKMVKEGVKDLAGIQIVPSGRYILSKDTFAQYFEKEQVQIVESMDYDIYIFGEVVVSGLGITHRFVGEEPFDKVTRKYNETMKKMLPNYGVEVIEIPRIAYKRNKERIISATFVRKALQDKEWGIIEESCPESTVRYLKAYKEYT